MEFEIGRFTRKCAATDRELQPGDEYYSVLIRVGADVERKDYLAAAWPGAPEEAICWWKSEMPAPNARKLTCAPTDAVLDYFRQLQGHEDAADQLYVLTLWMVRRRILRWEETRRDAQGREVMYLYSATDDTEFQVPVVEPSPERTVEIEASLTKLLFSAAE